MKNPFSHFMSRCPISPPLYHLCTSTPKCARGIMVTTFGNSEWVTQSSGQVQSKSVTSCAGMTAHLVLLAQTRVGFLSGGRGKRMRDLLSTEFAAQLEEAYARATAILVASQQKRIKAFKAQADVCANRIGHEVARLEVDWHNIWKLLGIERKMPQPQERMSTGVTCRRFRISADSMIQSHSKCPGKLVPWRIQRRGWTRIQAVPDVANKLPNASMTPAPLLDVTKSLRTVSWNMWTCFRNVESMNI